MDSALDCQYAMHASIASTGDRVCAQDGAQKLPSELLKVSLDYYYRITYLVGRTSRGASPWPADVQPPIGPRTPKSPVVPACWARPTRPSPGVSRCAGAP